MAQHFRFVIALSKKKVGHDCCRNGMDSIFVTMVFFMIRFKSISRGVTAFLSEIKKRQIIQSPRPRNKPQL